MEKFDLNKENIEVVEGKVVITSEELANAIQNGEVDFNSEEEAGYQSKWNFICQISG